MLDDLEHMVLGAAHRGKFNFLTGLLKCPPKKMFKKFKGFPEFPPTAKAMCDIASHFSKLDYFIYFNMTHLLIYYVF